MQDLTGDVNNDLSVDVIDIIMLIELVLNGTIVSEYNNIADLNNDSIFSVLDIVILVDIILNN